MNIRNIHCTVSTMKNISNVDYISGNFSKYLKEFQTVYNTYYNKVGSAYDIQSAANTFDTNWNSISSQCKFENYDLKSKTEDISEKISLISLSKINSGFTSLKSTTSSFYRSIAYLESDIETLEEAKSSLSDLYVGEKAGPNVQYPQIDALEGELLGSVYKTDDINVRLERLEKKVFGAKQEGDLSIRTDNLKRHTQNSIASNGSVNTVPRSAYGGFQNNGQMYESEIKFQLSALENAIFSTDFSQEPVPLRLVRLENKIFQRDFRDDDIQTRISRIQAAATAGKTAKYYDGNKFQKFASTGIQAASFLLMILAFIL